MFTNQSQEMSQALNRPVMTEFYKAGFCSMFSWPSFDMTFDAPHTESWSPCFNQYTMNGIIAHCSKTSLYIDSISTGNKYIHQLTSSGKYLLRVDLENFKGEKVYAKYSTFSVGNAATNYKLSLGSYSGTAGKCIFRENKTFSPIFM